MASTSQLPRGWHIVGVWQGLAVQGSGQRLQKPSAGRVDAAQPSAPQPPSQHPEGSKWVPRAPKAVQGMGCGWGGLSKPAGASCVGGVSQPPSASSTRGPRGTSGSSQVVPWCQGIPVAKGCPWAQGNQWYCKGFLSCNSGYD